MVSTFTRLIDLKAIRGDAFQAPPAPERSGRMYGGQLLAQGLAAAMLTTEADRDAHSLHAYFLRPGDVNLPSTAGNSFG
jgi:acyl-CoA thioesterase-2